jgi:hypothetical protein
VIRVDARLRSERPVTAYARLNIQRGSTPATVVRELPRGDRSYVDFDLAALRIDVSRAERLWLDLIFDAPAANGILLEDMILTRTPRAEV